MNDDVMPLNEIGKIGTVKVYNQAYVDNQQKRIEELENKIADIKANCDLAIEGRDIKIKELTERLEDLQEQNSEMFNTIALQEQQIEKMMCCGNCRFSYCERSSEHIDKDGNRTFHCWNEEKEKYCDVGKDGKYQCWEIKEND